MLFFFDIYISLENSSYSYSRSQSKYGAITGHQNVGIEIENDKNLKRKISSNDNNEYPLTKKIKGSFKN